MSFSADALTGKYFVGKEIAIVFHEMSTDRSLDAFEKSRVTTESQRWPHELKRETFSSCLSICNLLGIDAVVKKAGGLV